MSTGPEAAQARSRTLMHLHLCDEETTIVVDRPSTCLRARER